MQPNLFRWATSELSQDAFICWLLEWAKPEFKNEKLHAISIEFINELSHIEIPEILSLEVRKQYKNIDIVVVVNETQVILIEDKTHTKNHNNQLILYSELLKKEFDENKISLIYLKTGDQSSYHSIETKGYTIYRRSKFLNLLSKGKENGITNNIYIDFLRHLKGIDEAMNSFKTLPLNDWHWDSWKGFYIELQKRLGQGEWDYVPQKNGGFLGFWWNWHNLKFEDTNFDFYLQLEHDKFCFKIIPSDVKRNYTIRDHFRSILFKHAKKNKLNIIRNGRCIKGKTKTMTVAKLNSDFLLTDENNFLDIDATVAKIIEIGKIMDELYTAHNKP